ncbi:MAG TPA: DUF3052 family protein [Polyangiaceae bacterium]
MAGYSGTPLAKKLGIEAEARVLARNAPRDYLSWLDPLPTGATVSARVRGTVDIVHLFVTKRSDLARQLGDSIERIAPDGAIWVSWPKKAAKVATDITEDTVRELALPLGLVDVKVCAVSEIWSGLKLVIRKELR